MRTLSEGEVMDESRSNNLVYRINMRIHISEKRMTLVGFFGIEVVTVRTIGAYESRHI